MFSSSHSASRARHRGNLSVAPDYVRSREGTQVTGGQKPRRLDSKTRRRYTHVLLQSLVQTLWTFSFCYIVLSDTPKRGCKITLAMACLTFGGVCPMGRVFCLRFPGIWEM